MKRLFTLLPWWILSFSLARADEFEKYRVHIERLNYSPRVVAIGDLHGDLRAARKTLELAGAVDAKGNWVGQHLVVVQTGDLIDRGDHDLGLLNYFAKLEEEAKYHDSLLILINGNHEFMNLQHQFDYASKRATTQFNPTYSNDLESLKYLWDVMFPMPYNPVLGRTAHLEAWDDLELGLPRAFGSLGHPNYTNLTPRTVAFSPGSVHFTHFAQRTFFAIVGDTVFVHGGITLKALDYGLDRLQKEIQNWLFSDRDLSSWLLNHRQNEAPLFLNGEDSPIWSRVYGLLPPDPIPPHQVTITHLDVCSDLQTVLERLSVKRMVIGHTIQPNHQITSACAERVWRIDVGMSHGFVAPSPQYQVLNIQGEEIEVLSRRGSKPTQTEL